MGETGVADVNGRRPPGRVRDEGSAVVETALLVPVLVVVLLFAVMAGRIESARLHVGTAASSAARSASLARSPAAARTAAVAEAARSLASAGVGCPRRSVSVDTTAFRAGGEVKVTLTCHADLGDLAGLDFVPMDVGITRVSVSPVDTYRGIDGAAR